MRSPTPAPDGRAGGRRPEIQGLRALCMAQVFAYHAWQVGSPVGVDAFIMISAYLMTGSFLRRTEQGSAPRVHERWVHTFKRLLPPLVVTVLATVAAGLLVLPQTRWAGLVGDAVASVTYWQNWRLADRAADYFAQNHAGASPLQHLWSMSMQGQVFLLWPLLVAACAVLARRLGRSPRSIVTAAFGVLALASLGWLLLAAPEGGGVYFDTRARIWEFALGSAVAALAPRFRIGARAAGIAAPLALAVLLLYFTVSIGHYPGPMAAVPMLAVSTLLLTTGGPARDAVTGLLRSRPLVRLGDMSYCVYLVHWPVIVLVLAARHEERLGLRVGLAVLVAALALAWVLDRLVDRPAQRGPRAPRLLAKQAAVVVLSLLAGLVPLGIAQTAIADEQARALAGVTTFDRVQHPGATALQSAARPRYTADPIPGPLGLDSQWVPGFSGPCRAGLATALAGLTTLPTSCGTLAPAGSSADDEVVVVGDSHTEQTLVPVAEQLAVRNGWRARSILSGACAFGAARHYAGECSRRNALVVADLLENPPRVLLVQSTAASADSPDERLRAGLEEALPRLVARGITVVGVRDNIRSSTDLYECSSERPADRTTGGCVLDQGAHLAATDPALRLEQVQGYHEVDPTDLYCRDGRCPTIIGNVFVYLDAHHLTRTYSLTMAPLLADRVEKAMGAATG